MSSPIQLSLENPNISHTYVTNGSILYHQPPTLPQLPLLIENIDRQQLQALGLRPKTPAVPTTPSATGTMEPNDNIDRQQLQALGQTLVGIFFNKKP